MLVPLICAPPWSTPRRNPNTCPSPVPEYLECAHSALIPGTGEPPRETSNSWVGGLEDNCIKYENFVNDKRIPVSKRYPTLGTLQMFVLNTFPLSAY